MATKSNWKMLGVISSLLLAESTLTVCFHLPSLQTSAMETKT